MDIVCQKLDQQREELRQRILNEEKVKDCLKSFQKRISRIYDTAHMNALKIDNRRMKVLILQNAIKFVEYECEKLKQNPALFSSEFGSIIYNEIMEFSERTITHLKSDLQEHMRRCGYDNHSDTLSIASPPSVVSISVHDDSEEDHHSHSHSHSLSNKDDMIVVVHADDESARNKELDQISPSITEKDLQNLDDVVVKNDERVLSYRDQNEMDMVFLPPSLQNEFEEKFAKMTMSKKKELAEKVKIDDDVASTEDLLKFFYMEKYGKAKKRAKDEKLYEDEHFKSWYNETAKGKAHEFVNDKLKLKYDLYTFYKNKYGTSKLRKDEKKQFVYFSRSFQSWYKKKLSKKTSAVKKWLNEQKEKLSASTNSSSSSEEEDSVKKKGGGLGEVMGPQLPFACQGVNPLQKPFEGNAQQTMPECTLDSLINSMTSDNLKQFIINSEDDMDVSYFDDDQYDHIYEKMLEIDESEYDIDMYNYYDINAMRYDVLTKISEKEHRNYLVMNDFYSSFDFFDYNYSDNPPDQDGGACQNKNKCLIDDNCYDTVRLYSDIRHDFDESHTPKNCALTEDQFITHALKGKTSDLYKKLQYSTFNLVTKQFLDTPINTNYKYAVMDMRLHDSITTKTEEDGKLQEAITYGNLMDATMSEQDRPTNDFYKDEAETVILNRLKTIIQTFFQSQYQNITVTDLNYNKENGTFTMKMQNEDKRAILTDFNGKHFERNIVESEGNKLKSFAQQLGITDRKFVQMFKSLGDHIQLHELVLMKMQNLNNENLEKTIFYTRDRILVADSIRNDMDIIFNLTGNFFDASNLERKNLGLLQPFTEEAIQNSPLSYSSKSGRVLPTVYFMVYTNKPMVTDMNGLYQMFLTKVKLYSNIMNRIVKYVTSPVTGIINRIKEAVQSQLNSPLKSANFDANFDANFNQNVLNKIVKLFKSIFNNTGSIALSMTLSGQPQTPPDGVFTLFQLMDMGFAIIEQAIEIVEIVKMDNANIKRQTDTIMTKINEYISKGKRDRSQRSTNKTQPDTLESLYYQLHEIFFWTFLTNPKDPKTTMLNMLNSKFNSVLSLYDPVLQPTFYETIQTFVTDILTDTFGNPSSESKELDDENKVKFIEIHKALMDAGYILKTEQGINTGPVIPVENYNESSVITGILYPPKQRFKFLRKMYKLRVMALTNSTKKITKRKRDTKRKPKINNWMVTYL